MLNISENSDAEDLETLAFVVHALTGLPTTVRSLNEKGIRMEKGEIMDRDYTSPVLEEVLRTNEIIRISPLEGPYRRKPVVASPIRGKDGKVVASISVIDLHTVLDTSSTSKK